MDKCSCISTTLIHGELAENVNVVLNWDSQTAVKIRNSYNEIIIINNCWKYISGREDFQSIIVFFLSTEIDRMSFNSLKQAKNRKLATD